MRENKESMTIRVRVSPEIKKWLENHKAHRNLCNITSRAIEFYFDYEIYTKGFFIRLIENNFEVIKLFLRRIGRSRKELADH